MKRGRRRARGLALLLALLPALPSPLAGQDRPFPYQLRRADVALGAAAAASAALGFVLEDRVDPLAVSEISALDRGAVNGFDRFATDNWSTRWQDASDWTRDGLIVAAGLVTFLPPVVDQRWSDAATLAVIFAEAAALTAGVTNITKALAGRERPYLYNEDLTPEARAAVAGDTGEGSLSFFSGHASVSFAAATLLATTFTDIRGSGVASKLVWGGSLGAAALVAAARVEGGMHFPTDVLVGAAVGAAIGHLVPRLHRRGGPPLEVVAAPGYAGVRWRF